MASGMAGSRCHRVNQDLPFPLLGLLCVQAGCCLVWWQPQLPAVSSGQLSDFREKENTPKVSAQVSLVHLG